MRISKKHSWIFSLLMFFIFFTNCLNTIASAGIPTDLEGKWYKQIVIDSLEKRWIDGYPDGTFRGDNTITTAEFVSIVNSVFNLTADNIAENPFNDISINDWFYKDILIAYSNNLLPILKQDLNNNVMKPNQNILRQDAILILDRIKQIRNITEYYAISPIDQTSISEYAYNSVIKLYSLRIVQGNEIKQVKPLDELTRAEALALIQRTYNYINDLFPEFIEPEFEIKKDYRGYDNIYVTNAPELYKYSFKTNFETPKQLNKFTYWSYLNNSAISEDYTESPCYSLINFPATQELDVFVIKIWDYFEQYNGYIPKTGEKITMKIIVTNELNGITKDYYIDYNV